MTSKRGQVASWLDRAGVLRAVLAARRSALFPWRWLTVLTYHRVAAADAPGFDPDVVDATPEVFERQLLLLKRYFTLIDTGDVRAWREGGRLPQNPAMLTFDDGYRDNHDVLLPILRRHGAKAVFFIPTSYIGERKVFWWERINQLVAACRRGRLCLGYPQGLDLPLGNAPAARRAVDALLAVVKEEPGLDLERFLGELADAAGVPRDADEERRTAEALVMTWDHVRALKHAGMDVQSHAHAHRVLQTLAPDQAARDLRRARDELEGALGQPVHAVAYPTGRPLEGSPALRAAVTGAGYELGFTTERLAPLPRQAPDWLDLPRMMMDRRASEAFFRACVALPPLAY